MAGVFASRGIVSTALSLSVTTIGAGVLALPSVVQEGGIAFVLAVLLVVAGLTVLSIDYLVLCIDVLKLRSYEDLSRELLGRVCEQVIRWVLIVYTLGLAAGYIVVIGEIAQPTLPLLRAYAPALTTPTRVVVLFWLGVMLPLSCTPYLAHMHHLSYVAIAATLSIASVVVYRYYVPFTGGGGGSSTAAAPPPPPPSSSALRWLLALPVMMFAFDCQALVFQLYAHVAVPTRATMARVSLLSVTLTGGVYGLVGVFGYWSFRPRVRDNVLSNYDAVRDRLFAAAVLFYSVTITMAYALVIFPCRDAVLMLLYGYNAATHTHHHIPTRVNVCVSVAIAAVSLVLALCAPGILFIIAVLGAACSSTVCFTYPAAFRLALHARGLAPCTKPGELAAALAMLAVGLVSCVLGTVTALVAA